MSDNQSPNNPAPVLIVCLTLIIVTIIAAITSISLGPGADGRNATVVTILGGVLATSVATFSILSRVRDVNQKVDKVLNGVMDKKIKTQVLAALKEHGEETS